MKIKVGEGYKKSDGTFVHNVTIDDERFENVENIHKYRKCNSDNCKHFRDCSWNDGVVRRFDCKKNLEKAIVIYNFVTGSLVAILFFYLFLEKHVGLFKGAAILIFAMVGLDVLCSFIESIVPKIRDRYFYNKLKKRDDKAEAKKNRQKAEEDAKQATEEFEKMSQSPYYQDVLKAEISVNSLKKLSDEYDFGVNNEKVDQCVKKLTEIIELLKKDSSGYGRVAFLFEASLEELFNTLRMYTNFIKADIHNAKNEQLLTACVDSFLKYLNDQKVEAIFDKSSVEIQFRSSAEALRRMIDSKGEK